MAGRVMSLAHHGSYNPSAQNGGIISAAEISAQIDRASVASLRALPKSVSGDGRSFMTTVSLSHDLIRVTSIAHSSDFLNPSPLLDQRWS